jgi:RNA polymerase sigma-70 factor (ECF subfamily)
MMSWVDWNKILVNHGAALVLYARQWTRSHSDAEDAVQEGFLRLWRSGRAGGQEEQVLPQLFVSVKHAALDGIRSGQRRERREEAVSAVTTTGEYMFESELETRERNLQVQAAVGKLPAEQREVLVMKIWGDLTFKMIAEALDISINTAASRYRYALGALHEELEKHGTDHER